METLGLNLGYISPIGIKGIDVIIDDSVTMGFNFFAGANEKDFHFSKKQTNRIAKSEGQVHGEYETHPLRPKAVAESGGPGNGDLPAPVTDQDVDKGKDDAEKGVNAVDAA